MREIYWRHTALKNRPQSIDSTLVVRSETRTYRVTLHWDTSYAGQTRGSVCVLWQDRFEPILHLLHHDLTMFQEFDDLSPPERGELERAGKISGLLLRQAHAVARLARTIVEEKS